MTSHVTLRLDQPPSIAHAGVGVHGTISPLHDVYRLPDHWQFHLYGYTADIVIDGTRHHVVPGSVSLVPAGSLVEFHYRGRSQHHFAHFAVRGGGGGGDGDGDGDGDGQTRTLPAVQHRRADLTEHFHNIVTAREENPQRASAELWTALWRLTDTASATRPDSVHPAVATAIGYIESHLTDPIAVTDVARAAGVSHNHLTRLIHAHTGETVVGYIRTRRLRRAQHLLTASTLTIASIAATVGIPDLQAFNKACRREFGASPRALRSGQTAEIRDW